MIKSWLQLNHQQSAEAIHFNNKWYSKSELEQHAEQFVKVLQQENASLHERIALVSDSPWVQLLVFLACAKLGLVFFPVSAKSPQQSQQKLLENAGISLLIHDTNKLQIKRLVQAPCQHLQQLKEISLFITTSGTNSEPKVVMLGHQALTYSAKLSNELLVLQTQDCWLNALPLSHIGGISIVIRTALAGARMILHENFNTEKIWRDIITQQVTHISLVPSMLEKLLDISEQAPPPSLRVALIGGAALRKSLANRAISAGWPLCPTYGMSEMASQVATRLAGNESNQALPLLPEVQAKVLIDGKLLEQGTGQLYLKAKNMMAGYANVQNKPGLGLDNNNWLITSDIARLDALGNIQIIGRADDVLISGGEKIHPAEIESILLDCPGITQVCVIGQQDTHWGQRLCAVYCGNYDHKQLEQWCRSKLRGVYLPRHYLRVKNLPELANGKIDRKRVILKFC